MTDDYNETDFDIPDLDEKSNSQIPAILQLVNLAYEYISRDKVNKLRESKSKYIFQEIAFNAIRKINSDDISDKSIKDKIFELENVNMSDGVIKASEDIFSKLISGESVSEIIDGKNVSPQMKFIDFENPTNNKFHVVCEYEIEESHNRRPDIVLFINGIPIAVIENKKASVDVGEAVTQMIRNQGKKQTPKFFLFPQILIACNVREIKYGTMLTPYEFWSVWKEKDANQEEYERNVYKSIDVHTSQKVVTKVNYDLVKTDGFVGERTINEQDKGIYSLLRPERLLELIHGFIIYDNNVKKIARYQQYFAIKKVLKRVDHIQDNGKRKSGLIWHTQGSGKSLTMVMLVKALIEQKNIVLPRIVVVTDRKDLDKQIRDTFEACNVKKGVIQANNGQELLDLIKEKDLRVITTLIHKFESSKGKRDFIDNDPNVFILIDEAHRTQGGLANIELNKTLPKACQIAFTGTPLMSNEKSSINKFGGLIDSYTISEAEEDEAVLPLIYQARYVEQSVQQNILDKFYERATKELTEEQRKDLEKKFTSSKIIEQTSQRIEFIASDIIEHYSEFESTGLKAQVVAPSKYAAVMFKKAFNMLGFTESEVIISDVNSTDENDDRLPEHKKIVADFIDELKHEYGASLEAREKNVIKDFKDNPDGCKIIIVVDKLLTGFDAPRNTFLYLAKELKQHNLLQAIARVNRLFNGDIGKEAKTNGIIIDYSKNAQNLKKALELFSHYDIEDIKRALLDTDEKIAELDSIYQEIHSMFNNVKNKDDAQEYINKISCDVEMTEEFNKLVNSFIKVFSVCRGLNDFFDKVDDNKIERYALDMKKFIEIKKIVLAMNADTVDFSKYEDQIRRILNKYVSAEDVTILSKPINLSDIQEFNQFIEDANNGLSDKSKAEAIAAQTQKTISENWEKDPDFYKKFGQKVKELIAKLRDAKREDLYALLNEAKVYQRKVKDYEDNDIPSDIKEKKELHPIYRSIKKHIYSNTVSEELLSKIVQEIYSIVESKKIVDWDKNIEVEREVRNSLEDYLFDQVQDEYGVDLSIEKIESIVDDTWALAIKNKNEK